MHPRFAAPFGAPPFNFIEVTVMTDFRIRVFKRAPGVALAGALLLFMMAARRVGADPAATATATTTETSTAGATTATGTRGSQ